MDHFLLLLLPGRQVDRAVRLLRGLAGDVPPRVWFATFRALCNGWVTGCRFGESGPCVFGRAQFADRLDTFLALHVPHGPHTATKLSKRALVLYAAPSASCAKRHGGTGNAAEALVQYAREAAAGHPGLRRALADAWAWVR